MHKYIIIILLAMTVWSCKNEEQEQEVQKLKQEKQELIEQANQKDSTISAFINTFNNIEDNLQQIREKEKGLTIQSGDIELGEDREKQIIEDMHAINMLMEHNREMITDLNKRLKSSNNQLKNANFKITELERMLQNLNRQVEQKDMEIADLRRELVDLNIALDNLTVAYESQAEILEEQDKELHTAYYAFGTFKELKEKNVITKEGGFIGIGKTEKLREDFNKDYFTKIDIINKTSIPLNAKEVKIVTIHPAGSYKLAKEGDEVRNLLIEKPAEFWSVSKYLVVIVE